ncbi:hypothetical protein [Plantibacter sp. MPB07]|uniref:hypothetical protein n=1 Tax=Plantibacter sp. MPB07 TaxID=3388853 RepID=UPI0039883A35
MTGFVLTVYAFVTQTVVDKTPIIFWGSVGGVGLFLVVFLATTLPAGIRAAKSRRAETRKLIANGRLHEQEVREIAQLQSAVARWQDRAQNAEDDAFGRGRRRAAAEVAAALASPEFGATDYLERDGEVVIVAVIIDGLFPPPDSILFVESKLSGDVKAVLKCIGFMNATTAMLQVEEFRSLDRQQLLEVLRENGGLPASMAIVARGWGEDFGTER